jgi:hypothetical protein
VTASYATQVQSRPQQPVNHGALVQQDFESRVAAYLKLRATAAGDLPKLKPTDSPATIAQHEHEFAEKIREARGPARQGDLFTAAISAEFRRLIGITMHGPDAARIRQSLRSAEPVHLQLRVDDDYPTRVPLQSTPPTLLLNLPKLPPELDYRVVDRDLFIRDVGANLIVDYITAVIP